MLSEKPWNREVLLLLLAGLLICWSLGLLVGILLEQFLPLDAVQKSFYHFLIGALSFHVAALVLVDRFLKVSGSSWREFLGLTRPYLMRAIFLALGAGVLVLPIVLELNACLVWLMNLMGRTPMPQPAVRVLE